LFVLGNVNNSPLVTLQGRLAITTWAKDLEGKLFCFGHLASFDLHSGFAVLKENP
jgi:hypothetical protein